ncbi:hypothetical protein PH547_14785 [Rhizobium sp. CNPSo 3464]|nr:hypothetical protein [Rhizobium sp. CNPSo 3464]
MNTMTCPYCIREFERVEYQGQRDNRGNEPSIIRMKVVGNMGPKIRNLTR